jgi:hypothetical protein
LEKSDIASKVGSSGWHIAVDKSSGSKPYLGDQDVVLGLVSSLAEGVAERYSQVMSGDIDAGTAASRDRAECDRLAGIFLGENDGFETVGNWNTGGALPAFLREHLDHLIDIKEGDHNVVAQTFALVVHAAYQVIQHGDEFGAHLSELIADIAKLLLGMPVEEA